MKRNLITLVLLALCTLAVAQEGSYVEVRDLESWTSAEFKYKISKKWTFGLQEQIRLDNNSTEIKGLFTEFMAQYELFKNFKVAYGFRWINKNDNQGDVQGYEHFFRHQFDASYKHNIDQFWFKYRFRYTTRNEAGISKDEGDIPVKYLRLKATVGYKIKNWKFDPILSGELFNSRENGINYGLTNYRLTLGTEYKLKNASTIGLFYRMEQELNISYPKTTHIIRLNYTFTLKHK